MNSKKKIDLKKNKTITCLKIIINAALIKLACETRRLHAVDVLTNTVLIFSRLTLSDTQASQKAIEANMSDTMYIYIHLGVIP